MKNILQISVKDIPNFTLEVWYDVMEIPENVNNLKEFNEVAKKDFSNRKVRIIQIMEE